MPEAIRLRKADLPPGSRRIVRVGEREIGVFNIDGQIFAFRNRCPHQSGPVCEGGLFENVRAAVGPDGRVHEWIEDDGYILACPWHGWEFDVRGGTCLWDARLRLRSYAVSEDEEGNIVIGV